MEFWVVSLLLVTLVVSLGNCQSGTPCPRVDGRPTCVCSPTDGRGVIDATFLANPVGSSPKFENIQDSIGYAYSFNPCNSYSERLCGNVHSCQTSNFNDEVTYSIALAGTEKMHIDPDGVPYLFYTAFGQKQTYVYLHCTDDKEPRIIAHGDEAVFSEFIFEIYSRDVCPDRKFPSSVAAGGVGIAIIFLSLVAVAVYFAMGMIVMKVKFNATGVDLIPNRAFWKSFPFLLKDGTLLVISPCRRIISGPDSKDPSYSNF